MSNTYTPKANLPKPGTGDAGWSAALWAWADFLDTLADTQSFVVPYAGEVVLNDFLIQRKFSQAVTIKAIDISARDVPTGAAITIDCTLDGTEQSKIATLAATASFQQTTLTSFDVSNAQVFGLKIKQTGSTNIGGDLAVTVHYQPKAIATI